MGAKINGLFFMQTQNGEWVKLGEPVEFAETEAERNRVAFTIKPRTFTGTFELRSHAKARLRRKLLRFKGHPRIRGMMKAAKKAGIGKVASNVQ